MLPPHVYMQGEGDYSPDPVTDIHVFSRTSAKDMQAKAGRCCLQVRASVMQGCCTYMCTATHTQLPLCRCPTEGTVGGWSYRAHRMGGRPAWVVPLLFHALRSTYMLPGLVFTHDKERLYHVPKLGVSEKFSRLVSMHKPGVFWHPKIHPETKPFVLTFVFLHPFSPGLAGKQLKWYLRESLEKAEGQHPSFSLPWCNH